MILKANLLVRGEDKISIAPIHNLLRIFIGMDDAKYLHLPLLTESKDGKRLRGKAYYVDQLITQYSLEVLVAYALKSGYVSGNSFYRNINDFIGQFDYRKIKKKSGRFTPADLQAISIKFEIK